MFAKQELDACYCQVLRARGAGRGYSTLPAAARTLSVCGWRVPDIIKLMVEGELQCWSDQEAPALAQLTFSIADIETLLKSRCAGLELLDEAQAAERVGVEVWTLLHWASSGLFPVAVQYAYTTYFDVREIEGFLAAHMTSKEAAQQLNVPVQQLTLWYGDWGLASVRGIGADGRPLCLFSRAEVERLRVEFCTSD